MYKLELWPGGLAVEETRLGSMLQCQRYILACETSVN